jgi:hypothetical protein
MTAAQLTAAAIKAKIITLLGAPMEMRPLSWMMER